MTPQPTSRAAAPCQLTALVQRARGGDEHAWRALVSRFGASVRAVARGHRLSATDQDEVAQRTWLRLVEHIDRVQEPAALGAWLATTARREALRLLAHAARDVPTEALPDGPAADEPLDERLVAAERCAAVRAALERLPARHGRLLRALAEDPAPSYEDVGRRLGMPVGSIGPTRARGLGRLRRDALLLGALLAPCPDLVPTQGGI